MAIRISAFIRHVGVGSMVALCLCSGGRAELQAPVVDPARAPAAPKIAVPLTSEITKAEIEAHVRFLASDELQGRMTGTKEADQAARYLALVLEKEGVEPAGDDHTFLKAVELERTRVTAPAECSIKLRNGESLTLIAGRDFDLTGPGIAVKDLRLVVVANEAELPKAADPKVALFLDTTSSRRQQWLEKAGLGTGEGFGLLVQPGSAKAGAEDRVDSRPSSPRRKAPGPKRRTNLRPNGTFLERVRKGEVESLSITSHVETESITGYNVLGRLAGKGTHDHPELAAQAIVISAHYDHLGGDHEHPAPPEKAAAPSAGEGAPSTEKRQDAAKTEPPVVDRIFNGADDDASGCAAVLEIAGAFAAAPGPARTLIFLFATGEEVGLLGTDDYLEHPTVALEHTIANLNFEMIGRPDPLVGGTGIMWLTGFERTNLGPAFQAAGLPIKLDPRPDQHFYERSDNIAFVRRGIVGQTFSTFNLHKDYHQASDEADRIDYAHMEACVQSGYQAVKLVADGSIMPEWVEGKGPSARK